MYLSFWDEYLAYNYRERQVNPVSFLAFTDSMLLAKQAIMADVSCLSSS
jgi:hypothetical protein